MIEFYLFTIGFGLGIWAGGCLEARLWRIKGDHKYMNRMASGRNLYFVKNEKNLTTEEDY